MRKPEYRSAVKSHAIGFIVAVELAVFICRKLLKLHDLTVQKRL
jgi:hypothetical protein